MEMCKWGEDGNEAYPNLNEMFETSARKKILRVMWRSLAFFFLKNSVLACPECLVYARLFL